MQYPSEQKHVRRERGVPWLRGEKIVRLKLNPGCDSSVQGGQASCSPGYRVRQILYRDSQRREFVGQGNGNLTCRASDLDVSAFEKSVKVLIGGLQTTVLALGLGEIKPYIDKMSRSQSVPIEAIQKMPDG